MAKSKEQILADRAHVLNRINDCLGRLQRPPVLGLYERSEWLYTYEDYVVRLKRLPDPESERHLEENTQLIECFVDLLTRELEVVEENLKMLQKLVRRHKLRSQRAGKSQLFAEN